jgi:hypothetical protein
VTTPAVGQDAAPGAIRLIGPGPDFDPQYAMGTDPDEPVIIASIPVAGEPPAPLLIDGVHRPYKAARLGREHQPSLVLTVAETLAIRHDATLVPARTEGRP